MAAAEALAEVLAAVKAAGARSGARLGRGDRNGGGSSSGDLDESGEGKASPSYSCGGLWRAAAEWRSARPRDLFTAYISSPLPSQSDLQFI